MFALMISDLETRRQAGLAWVQSEGVKRLNTSTRDNIAHWLTQPGYKEFWPALIDLIEAHDDRELTRLFWERIPFGTGGRRGPMADLGSATINRRTIAESAWGLAHYVLSQTNTSTEPAAPRKVAIAFDSRLRSEEFAQLTACVFAAAGFHVWLFATPHATPQLSYAVRELVCDCGVMISASHNPPSDNGFKAYGSNGVQVLPPHDTGIITYVDQAAEIPIAEYDAAVAAGQIQTIGADLDDRYISTLCQLSYSKAREIRLLYTPLHGVGEASVYRVLKESGFAEVEIFEPQRTPDGLFPHVPDHLPNPERTAVFGPAIMYAEKAGHDLILASDPDADRLAVAVRTREGRYACLNGNQLGALLTDFVLSKADDATRSQGLVLETLVTTPLIAAIARAYRVKVIDDLPVGFKHIGSTMEELPQSHLLFAAEESLGYLAGNYCRDKDASVGALYTAELAAELKSQGKTLLDQLQVLYRKHGWYREAQTSQVCPGPEGAAKIAAAIARFRNTPPSTLGDAKVQRIRDFGRQEIRSAPAFQRTGRLTTHAGDLIFADVTYDGVFGQVALRPSGTEPKIKCYFFTQSPPEMPFGEADERTIDLMKLLQSSIANWLQAGF
ncbi:phospho-sugar mutase [bacterium]|nr:phospho-sugar mutase [bacterium]